MSLRSHTNQLKLYLRNEIYLSNDDFVRYFIMHDNYLFKLLGFDYTQFINDFHVMNFICYCYQPYETKHQHFNKGKTWIKM